MNKEKIISVCRRHWSNYIIHGFLAVSCLGAAFYVLLDGETDIGVSVVSLALLSLPVVCILIDYKTTYIRITETMLEGNVGFIRSKTLTTPLKKIQNISLSNGLIGKILGYHTITISDAGGAGTEYVFKRMSRAKKFVEAAQKEMAK